MSENFVFTIICLPLGTILLIFAMRYFSAIQQAKFRFANDEAYRQIATKTAAAQVETTAALSAIDAMLSDVKARVTAIEKILKEVE